MNGVGPKPPREEIASSDHPPRSPISDDPLINAFHRRLAEIALGAYAALVVYMSFVPFDFARVASAGDLPQWRGLPIGAFSLRDILANIAIYVPFGMLIGATLRARGGRWLLSGPLTVLTTAALSLGVEHGQQFVASRVSSWVDVTSNVLGAALGLGLMMLGEGRLRLLARRSRWAARQNWPLTLAKAAVCTVLIVQLRPYDPVVDVLHTAADLRHAALHPLTVWNDLPAQVAREVAEGQRNDLNEVRRAQWEYALDRAADTVAYAAITVLLALGLSHQCRRWLMLFAWTGFVVVSLATMITGLRVFLISHGPDTSQIVCGMMGWLLGGFVVAALWRRAGTEATGQAKSQNHSASQISSTPTPVPGRLWRIGVTAVLLIGLLYEIVPFDFVPHDGGMIPEMQHRPCLMPFLAHFHARPNDALHDISGELLRYGLIGLSLALILRHKSRAAWRRQLFVVTAGTTLLSVASETLHLVMPSRGSDVTTVLLALSGGFAGAVAVRWAADYRIWLEVEFSDDLLTSQLVEGATYQPLPKPSATRSPQAAASQARRPNKSNEPPSLN